MGEQQDQEQEDPGVQKHHGERPDKITRQEETGPGRGGADVRKKESQEVEASCA